MYNTHKSNIHATSGIRTRNPSKRTAANPHLRPLGHLDRQDSIPVPSSTQRVAIPTTLCRCLVLQEWGTKCFKGPHRAVFKRIQVTCYNTSAYTWVSVPSHKHLSVLSRSLPRPHDRIPLLFLAHEYECPHCSRQTSLTWTQLCRSRQWRWQRIKWGRTYQQEGERNLITERPCWICSAHRDTGTVFSPVLLFSPVSNALPTPHTHISYIRHGRYIMFATESVVKYNTRPLCCFKHRLYSSFVMNGLT